MDTLNNKIENLKKNIKENDEFTKDSAIEILQLMQEICEEVKEVQEDLRYMNDDISEVQNQIFEDFGEFEEVSLEELEEIEDEYAEVACEKCGKPVFVEKVALENNDIPCPYCGEKIK